MWKKYGTARHDTDDNIIGAHALCMPDNRGKNTVPHSAYVKHFFSTCNSAYANAPDVLYYTHVAYLVYKIFRY